MTQFSLTPNQAKMKAFIADYMARNNGIAPSYAEILEGTGMRSRSQVAGLVKALVDRGHLEVLPNKARAMRIKGDLPNGG